MEIKDYESNSYKSRKKESISVDKDDEKDKKLERVVTGTVKAKKKNGLQRMISTIFVPEDIKSVTSYIIGDIVVPNIKDMIVDSIATFFGVEKFRTSSTPRSSSRYSYRDYYENNNGRERERKANRVRSGSNDLGDIIFDTRRDAERVLSRMDDIVDEYDVVSVSDVYELIGILEPYTNYKYGWTKEDVRNATIVHVRNGYFIKLPRALPID